MLGPGIYGLFSFGQSFVNLSRIMALLGLEVGGTRYTARFRTQQNSAAERRMARDLVLLVFAWGTIIAIGFFFLIGPLSLQSEQDVGTTVAALRWFVPAIPLSALLFLLTALAEGQRRIALGVITRDVLRPALTVILAFVVLWFGRDIISVVQVYTLSMLLAVLATGFFLYRYLPKKSGKDALSAYSFREVINFSLPLFPTRLLKQVGNYLEIFILGFLATSIDVGVFSAAARSAGLVAFGLQAIMRIYMTLAAELHTKEDYKQLESLQHLATRWATLLSIPSVLAVILVGEGIMALFGESFIPYKNILVILALGQAVNAATGPISGTLSMAGHSRLLLFNSISTLTLNIVLDLYLINRFGVIGAAIGSAVVMVIANLMAVIEVRIILGIQSFGRDLLRPAIAGVGTLLISWPILNYLDQLPTLIHLALGLILIGLCYAALYWPLAPAADKEMVHITLRRLRGMRFNR
jgi:O-antigen/teichoic acid export membrane protein